MCAKVMLSTVQVLHIACKGFYKGAQIAIFETESNGILNTSRIMSSRSHN